MQRGCQGRRRQPGVRPGTCGVSRRGGASGKWWAMSTGERSAGRRPMYARLLRLRRIRVTGLVSFLLMECTVAAAVLLALAELVSWWAVPLLPVLVAAGVKINDMVGGPTNPADAARSHPIPGRAEPWDREPDVDERYVDERYVDERYVDERYVDEQHGHQGEPVWPDESVTLAHDWYADNPTQEIL